MKLSGSRRGRTLNKKKNGRDQSEERRKRWLETTYENEEKLLRLALEF